MWVSLRKADGKLIEMQGGGTAQAHLDSLKKNALGWGYKEDEIEVKAVTDEEYAAILAANPDPPPSDEEVKEQLIQAEMQKILREQAIANLTAEGKV